MSKIGRNEICPCGSGEKYKNCCGAPISQSSDELKKHLIESVEFLIKSCLFYDTGDKSEAKRIALELRKLLHDTGMSKSILKTLKIKNTSFIDTSTGYSTTNLLSTFALTSIKIINNDGQTKAEYMPLLDTQNMNKKLSFDKWWNNVIICDNSKNTFSRKNIVLSLANQDGGGHVDEGIEREYYKLTRENTIGWTINNNGKEIQMEDVHLATVRQIAHEIIRTLTEELVELNNNQYVIKYNNLLTKIL
ncbi:MULTISPECIES: SEC-C metal-binding domain-containing protein [unclassified Clostridium]|uniref:YecA family protein n=1 Tax=unclassified Clostridium TaxID=2614128 RepID=UPI00207AF201|nr:MULTISPECIES: SEC-C metal-binding domain-containing protein [unclassified Clostridium]